MNGSKLVKKSQLFFKNGNKNIKIAKKNNVKKKKMKNDSIGNKNAKKEKLK